MKEALKRRVRDTIQIPSQPGDKLGAAFDFLIMSLIVLNTGAVIYETLPGVEEAYGAWLYAFELFSVGIFGGEYLLRLWSVTTVPGHEHPVKGRLRWMRTPFAIIDLLAILPVFLFALDLRFLRILRVLRILKLGRYAESVQILGNVMRRSFADLLTSLFLVLLALVIVSSVMYYAERDAQPEAFESIPGAMWWGIITLTTTGYGDVVPVTAAGRAIAGLTSIIGVAAIALPIGILSSSFVEEVQARRKQRAELCPHCGEDIHQPKAVRL